MTKLSLFALAFLGVGFLCRTTSASASDDFQAAIPQQPEDAGFSLSHDLLNGLFHNSLNDDVQRRLEPSLELRRLSGTHPETIPRSKGVLSLLGSLGLLGHAGDEGFKGWGTVPVPAATVSLENGKVRFDTTNLGIYPLLLGLLLLYTGARRRMRSHKDRERWMIDEQI